MSHDDGLASLLAVAMIAVLAAMTGGGAYVGAAVVARHRAQAAADLAALAAAARLAGGHSAACEQAAVIARAMHSAVTRCDVEALDVVVAVDVPVMLGRIGSGTAHATARAGPVGP